MATIKMARECAARHIPNAHDNYNDQVANGLCDEHWPVKIALDMHAMRQAEIDELLAQMRIFVDRVDAGEIRSKHTYAKFKQLIAKHRPDAFAKWADGLIEGDTE